MLPFVLNYMLHTMLFEPILWNPKATAKRKLYMVKRLIKGKCLEMFYLALFLDHVEELELENEVKVPLVVKTTFHMHSEGSLLEDTCLIKPFQPDTLDMCNYNTSNPLVIIIHGWTVRMNLNLKTNMLLVGYLLGEDVYE